VSFSGPSAELKPLFIGHVHHPCNKKPGDLPRE
jgi:hypothetical protein